MWSQLSEWVKTIESGEKHGANTDMESELYNTGSKCFILKIQVEDLPPCMIYSFVYVERYSCYSFHRILLYLVSRCRAGSNHSKELSGDVWSCAASVVTPRCSEAYMSENHTIASNNNWPENLPGTFTET